MVQALPQYNEQMEKLSLHVEVRNFDQQTLFVHLLYLLQIINVLLT